MRILLSLFLLLTVLACVVASADDADILIADSKPVPVVGNNDPTTPIIQVQQKESSAESTMENDVLEVESLRDEGDSSGPVFSESELKRWPMKTLKEFIASKGLTCKGCSEKEDYVKMAFKNQHLPSVETAPSEPLKKDPDVSREEIDELMEKLRRGGMGNSKFFSANDLQGLSPEELAEKINGKGASPKKSKKPKSKSSTKSSQKDSSTGEESSSTPEKKPKTSTKKDRSKGKDSANGKGDSKESKESKESDTKKEKAGGKRKSNSSKSKKSGKSQQQSSSHSSGSSGKPHARVEEVMEEETIEL